MWATLASHEKHSPNRGAAHHPAGWGRLYPNRQVLGISASGAYIHRMSMHRFPLLLCDEGDGGGGWDGTIQWLVHGSYSTPLLLLLLQKKRREGVLLHILQLHCEEEGVIGGGDGAGGRELLPLASVASDCANAFGPACTLHRTK